MYHIPIKVRHLTYGERKKELVLREKLKKYRVELGIRYPERWVLLAQDYGYHMLDNDPLYGVRQLLSDLYYGQGVYQKDGPRSYRAMARMLKQSRNTIFDICQTLGIQSRPRGGPNFLGKNQKEDI
jgi:hypothetical protein